MIGGKNTKLRELQKKTSEGAGTCRKCGRVTQYLTVDHIVPFYFIEAIGLKVDSQNHDWNFELLCRPCNSLKGARWDFTDPRTFENLERYVLLAKQYYKV